MAPIGNAMMIMYLSRGVQRRREESVTIDVLIWRNREGDESGFTLTIIVFIVCGFTSSSLVSDVNLLPPLLLASIRRWCSKKIVIAAT